MTPERESCEVLCQLSRGLECVIDGLIWGPSKLLFVGFWVDPVALVDAKLSESDGVNVDIVGGSLSYGVVRSDGYVPWFSALIYGGCDRHNLHKLC